MSENPFESGARKLIPATLVYLRHQGRMLMIHRNGKPGDHHSGKWNGLGGKLEVEESASEAASREVAEESGIQLSPDRYRPLGVLHFPNFKAHRSEDWVVFLFTADLTEGEARQTLTPSLEGELHWVEDAKILDLNLWAGDLEFLPLVLAGKPVLGTLWYEGSVVRRATVLEF